MNIVNNEKNQSESNIVVKFSSEISSLKGEDELTVDLNNKLRLDKKNENINENLSHFRQVYHVNRFERKKDSCDLFKKKYQLNKKKFMKNVADLGFYKNFLFKRVPILEWLPKYKFRSYITSDVIGGFTVAVMNIPQGMAYSLIATLGPVNGLYMSFFPILIYCLLGTSKHLAPGAIAIISLLSGSAIDKAVLNSNLTAIYENNKLNGSNITQEEIIAKYRIDLACSLSFLVGIFQILMGLFGLGFVTSYLSDTFISGYTCGSAFQVIISQIKDIMGLRNIKKFEGIFKIPKSIVDLLTKISSLNWVTFGVSTICIAFLLTFKEFVNPIIKKRYRFEFPSELLLVIIMTTASYLFQFNSNFEVSIVKTIPRGLPVPSVPKFTNWTMLIPDAFLISIIGFSIAISLATLFARKKELLAFGASNIFGSFFSCFPSSGSLSRSSILDSIGSHSQIASLFGSGIILVVILWLGPLFESLPKNCLACIIVVALKSLLLQYRDFLTLWKINKLESITWIATFLSTFLLNIDYGLFIGIGVSIFMIVVRDQFLPIKALVQYQNSSNYVDENIIKDNDDQELRTMYLGSFNVKLFKLEHSLYFANCDAFQNKIYKLYGFAPLEKILNEQNEELKMMDGNYPNRDSRNVLLELEIQDKNNVFIYKKDPDIILDFSSVSYIDTNGIKILTQIVEDYKKVNVLVCVCNAQDSLIKLIYSMKLIDKYEEHMFITIEDALKYLKEKRTFKNFNQISSAE